MSVTTWELVLGDMKFLFNYSKSFLMVVMSCVNEFRKNFDSIFLALVNFRLNSFYNPFF